MKIVLKVSYLNKYFFFKLPYFFSKSWLLDAHGATEREGGAMVAFVLKTWHMGWQLHFQFWWLMGGSPTIIHGHPSHTSICHGTVKEKGVCLVGRKLRFSFLPLVEDKVLAAIKFLPSGIVVWGFGCCQWSVVCAFPFQVWTCFIFFKLLHQRDLVPEN